MRLCLGLYQFSFQCDEQHLDRYIKKHKTHRKNKNFTLQNSDRNHAKARGKETGSLLGIWRTCSFHNLRQCPVNALNFPAATAAKRIRRVVGMNDSKIYSSAR